MSIIIEATASRIRPALRSASARSLHRPTYCSRVFGVIEKNAGKGAFSLAIARPLAVAQTLIFVNFG
jgi:hypothetical protein